MFKVSNIEKEKALLLAPMEDVTDISYRLVCRELGADVVYTEFVNAEGIIRKNEKTHKKLKIIDEERPVGIQIYGGRVEAMIEAARIAESHNPDIIDINAGCWVKGIVAAGAGAGMLKDPVGMQNTIKSVIDSVETPVTVKTRIGWDHDSINILEVAKRLEDIGVKAITVHCRTRSMGHKGDADWEWINKVKEVVSIPVALNGNVLSAEDVVRAFNDTKADAVMIARGAIGYPWIFKDAKALLAGLPIRDEIPYDERIRVCLRHLKLATEVKGERRAILEQRKYYSGYLKGLVNASHIRQELMKILEYSIVEELLLKYEQQLSQLEHAYANFVQV
ncbi:MAG: tRNA dihydrouridine synthase DusB [Ignavibacteriales bacterium]|nr:MAG: tRNA dihydrouridine synthase DusB [Ignavibacteriaceae bacterium]MBW7872287.1 tRNA dihydrouridine synthase DusB [Ignavibacteria bacterium]MCZ2142569.1 tRNA dihydrouridine synthase DusB [Ignavibacteriales bacterium]MBV6445566.1 putative tRNA-dihydrouridine synthase [Ignavibacteriaceae bacterium]MBZ0196513.1 tRNA dihydrouridine synthase DusB [Ignavibacteriaceae bacterium]